jgi:hypothetical protein
MPCDTVMADPPMAAPIRFSRDGSQPSSILRQKLESGALGNHVYRAYSRPDGRMLYFMSPDAAIDSQFSPAPASPESHAALWQHQMLAVDVPVAVAKVAIIHEMVQRQLDRIVCPNLIMTCM